MHFATSTREMAPLVQVEDALIGYMRQYARELQLKVDTMRIFQKEWATRRQQGPADPTTYVANPLISFPLMRRMYTDAPKLLEFAREEMGQALDIKMAATGFIRFRDVYDLDESEVANGKLHGTQYNSRLSAADCLALGTHLESLQKGKQACKWLRLALEQYEDHMDPVNRLLQSSRSQIYEKLGLTLLSMHDLPASQTALRKSIEWASKDDSTSLAKHLVDNLAHMLVHVDNCRGKNPLPRNSSLRCRYFSEGSPFLRLAPMKLEQLNLEPFIGLYHEVVSREEQQDLMYLTRSRLEHRQVDRSSAEAEVAANASDHVKRLHRRIEDMTGLDLKDSEPLTVFNYGIGGQQFIHMDCEQPKEFIEPFIKEYRTATVQLYLSDVEMGGYASFPDLKIGFKPKSGSALVWHNIDNSGNCDIRSLNAICPVLLGTRWGKSIKSLIDSFLLYLPSGKQWPEKGSVGRASGAGNPVGSEGKAVFHSVFFFHFCDNLFNNFVVIYIMIINFMHYFIVFIFNLYAM
ncbi:prolyl 4-hydroxylase subunit alpha-2 isoform X2 [Drosophila gunungcola]|uniref:prolyl 4-hydroxylase subunit alpha-2 isoform X2 n=1 Tax=Drosophila gunungcola TaxID=103775 RepID=UPI0022DE978C|nr:prolyl 4-hydroxylase subunit alpha-2 isoform X2 [Drosophila gunungcola]